MKDELDFCRQILVNAKADIPRRKSKMGKGVGVGIVVLREKQDIMLEQEGR